eukprot:GHVS01098666.1.p1 GENE.GHVS01098666.1~~GHVS01098666.1.p1  ORF type:complete len:505 (-),score=129.37 GHVS01098666.1:398-1912(-)
MLTNSSVCNRLYIMANKPITYLLLPLFFLSATTIAIPSPPLPSLHNLFFPSPLATPAPPATAATRPSDGSAVHWVVYLIGFPVVPGSTDVRHIQQKLLEAVPNIQFFKVNYPKYIAGRGIDVAVRYSLAFVETYLLPLFKPNDKISFFGHSFGGLVGRDLIVQLKRQHPTVWASLVRANFVSLGAPHSGQAAAAHDMMYVLSGTPLLHVMGTERYARQISTGDSYLPHLAEPAQVDVMKEFQNVALYGVPGSLERKHTSERPSTDLSDDEEQLRPKLEWMLRKDWMVNVGNELMLPRSFRMTDAEWDGGLPEEGEQNLVVRELMWPATRRVLRADDDESAVRTGGGNEVATRGSFPVGPSDPLSTRPCAYEALYEEIQSASFLFTHWLSTYSLTRDMLSLLHYTPIARDRSRRYYETLDKLSAQMRGGNIHRYALFVPDWVYQWGTNELDVVAVGLGRGHLALAAMTAEEAAMRTAWCGGLIGAPHIARLVEPVAEHVMQHFVM